MPNYFGVAAVQPIDRQNRVAYTATSGQNTFSATYTPGYVDVYKNGTKLKLSDFAATNGASITLSVPASAGDYIEIIGIKTSSPYDFYTKAQTNLLINRFSLGVTGNGNAMTFSSATPTLLGMTDGTELIVRPPSANTSTAPTLNLSSISMGTKTITAAGGNPLPAGAWPGGADIVLRYNLTLDKLELIGVGTTFATDVQAFSGTSTNLMLSPAGLRGAFTSGLLLGAGGYQKFPGGLILQWNSVVTSVSGDVNMSFPIAFPTACRSVVATYVNGNGSDKVVASFGPVTQTTVAVASYLTTTGARASSSVYVIAVGE